MNKFIVPILLIASSLNAGSFCKPCDPPKPTPPPAKCVKPDCKPKDDCCKPKDDCCKPKKDDCCDKKPCEVSCFDFCDCSFYAGVAVGTGALAGNYKIKNQTTFLEQVSNLGGNSLLAGKIFGVRGCFCDCGYFGVEGNILFDTFSDLVYRNFLDAGLLNGVNLENQFQYGVDGRFGVSICKCKISAFGIFGWQAGEWEMKLINDTLSESFGVPAQTTIKVKKTLSGPRVGFGVAAEFCKCFLTQFTFAFVSFGDIKTFLTDSESGEVWKHRCKVQQNQALLSGSFRF